MCVYFAGRRHKKKENEPPLRLLDDLFRKTTATPCIYWLPLTAEQVSLTQIR
jgi:apoptotic chromatin condensation inducer in the nucleus